jgi:hypothetical protein
MSCKYNWNKQALETLYWEEAKTLKEIGQVNGVKDYGSAKRNLKSRRIKSSFL